MRPANVVTAIADILAGIAIAGLVQQKGIPAALEEGFPLILSTIGLYAGGIVFNDIFDLETDSKERPERILPSAKIALRPAITFGSLLLAFGVVSAFFSSPASGAIAFTIALLVLSYDKYTKHIQVLGPLNMGLCRAGNLLLGISILPASLPGIWWIALIPIIFIAAITLTSQKEVSGGNRSSIQFALLLDFILLALLFYLSVANMINLLTALPFIAIWAIMNISSKIKAISQNTPQRIQTAVRMGVLSLIPLDAGLASGFDNSIYIGLLVLLLLPLSVILARQFSVT